MQLIEEDHRWDLVTETEGQNVEFYLGLLHQLNLTPRRVKMMEQVQTKAKPTDKHFLGSTQHLLNALLLYWMFQRWSPKEPTLSCCGRLLGSDLLKGMEKLPSEWLKASWEDPGSKNF